jgi:choline dehydrogenase-like flavoprotein
MADAFDYIVVGSGAGGGTVAARLAEAGRRVLLPEACGMEWVLRVLFPRHRPDPAALPITPGQLNMSGLRLRW